MLFFNLSRSFTHINIGCTFENNMAKEGNKKVKTMSLFSKVWNF